MTGAPQEIAGTSSIDSSHCNDGGGWARENTMPAFAASSDVKRLSDREFKTELVMLIPQLRAFARGPCGRPELADDLTQEAMLRAWGARDRFQAGTNLRAWLFVILRNIFLSQMRRARFAGAWDDSVAGRKLAIPPSQEHHLQVGDLQRALLCLPETQREALILVAACGFSYEEAAQICGRAVGTIKSRVARARTALERIFADGTCPPRAGSAAQTTDTAEGIVNEGDRIVASKSRRGKGMAAPSAGPARRNR